MPKGGKKKGQKAEAPKEEPVPAPPEEEIQVEEEDVGLGISGSKRKQRKEKKQQQELARQAVITTPLQAPGPSREQSEAPEEPPKQKPEVDVKVEEIAEEMDGLGLGLGGAKKKRPKKKKNDAPPAAAATPATPAAASAPTSAPAAAYATPPAQMAAFSEAVEVPNQGPSCTLVQMKSSPSHSLASSSASAESGPPGAWGKGKSIAPAVARPIPTSQSIPVQQQPPKQPPTGTKPNPKSQYSQENVMCRYKIPTKIPGRNVNCRVSPIIVNYLEMTFKPLNISRYDVSFTPDRPKKLIPEVFKIVKNKYYANELLAFDQSKNCYSLRPLANVLPNERFNTSVEITDQNGRIMKFEVSIKATGVVELGKIKRYMAERGASVLHPTEEVQCIDVILRQGTLESYVKAGRQFFRRPARPIDLGYGYEMWTGLFQSAIFTSKSFINIDVAHKGFPKKQSLVNALINDFHLDPNKELAPYELTEGYFAAFMKGLRVVATIVGDSPSAGQKREYICNQLLEPPDRVRFEFTDPNGVDRKISVAEYYAKYKKYRIKYPRLNCVWVGPREKTIYFPMELLEVSYGQPMARQLNELQVSKMVKEAATPPDKRLEKITECISSMKYSTNPDFKRFGLDIADKFYQVNAKILEPPSLDIGRGQNTIPRKGIWQANQLLRPETLGSWGFVAVEASPQVDFETVIYTLINAGRGMGMNVSNPQYKKYDATLETLFTILGGAVSQGIKFMFIIVPVRGRDYYHKIKQMAEREVGILTQCIKEATARRMNAMTAKNILLKVNSKLMGINQALGEKTMPRCLKDGGVMIVGADVTHPSPEQSNVPSIAAVTASIDPKCYMYNIELSIQTPKKEMIVQFEEMMLDHLSIYKERNGQLPRKIFVFRDGVSEGQFVQVMNSELAAVHNAYARMAGATKKPEILFLLVQKRHHTRFFNRGEAGKYNVEPGTVVDTDIVHASELDFYLVSHQAIKGTARPTRYHAVCNDGKIPDDEVEQLTYYLCHLYSRCMRSVSYPTPTYYAHLACLRARSLTFGIKFSNKDLELKPKRLHVLDKMLQHSRMFFV